MRVLESAHLPCTCPALPRPPYPSPALLPYTLNTAFFPGLTPFTPSWPYTLRPFPCPCRLIRSSSW